MRKETLQAISELDRILSEAAPKRVPDGVGVTVIQYAQRFGLAYETARRKLVKLVADGRLKVAGVRGSEKVYDVA